MIYRGQAYIVAASSGYRVCSSRRRLKFAFLALPVLCVGWLSPIAAWAQSGGVPATVDPNRLSDNIEGFQPPKSTARVLLEQVPEPSAPDTAAKTRFVWRGFQIEGAESLPVSQLLREWRYEPGTEVTLEDVFRFANAITRVYGKAGYALAFGVVPEQQIRDGIVRIRVVEGFVDKVVFVGGRLPKGALGGDGPVSALAEKIKKSRPLKTADLERYLLLMNDLPGVSAQGTLSPSPDVLGGSVLTIRITRKRLATDYGYNSYMPGLLDTHVFGGSMALNSIVSGSDRIRIAAHKSIASDAYWSVSGEYSTQLGANGLAVGVTGAYTETRPASELLQILGYSGRAANARVFARYPIIRSRAQNLAVDASAGLTNTDSELLATRETQDRVRNAQLGLTYSIADSTRGVTSLRLEVEKGLDVLDARGTSRANGRTDYLLLTLEMQRLQPLGKMGGGPVSASLSMFGQVVRKGPLLSAAECSYGGRRYGRRFDAGVLTGENCLLASAEIRWNPPITLGKVPFAAQLYGFVDGGRVYQKGPVVVGEVRKNSAVSAGTGIRANLTEHITGGFEASRVLHTPTDTAFGKRNRFMGSLSFSF
jgi:hemolysin activation/secretion protein